MFLCPLGHALALSLTLLIAGCAQEVYAPATQIPGTGEAGFREARLSDDTWNVSYVGPATMSRDRASELALIRAAEVALNEGSDFFRIVAVDDTPLTSTRSMPPGYELGQRDSFGTLEPDRRFGDGVAYVQQPATRLRVQFALAEDEGDIRDARAIVHGAAQRGILLQPPRELAPAPSPANNPAPTGR